MLVIATHDIYERTQATVFWATLILFLFVTGTARNFQKNDVSEAARRRESSSVNRKAIQVERYRPEPPIPTMSALDPQAPSQPTQQQGELPEFCTRLD